jgi:acyl-CoA synthetase (AMP-forming)/AMP-acid ligase II
MIFRSPWPDIEVPSCSICDTILSTANQQGDKPAVIEGETGHILTYRQLSEGADRAAAGLSRAGPQPRQPLAVVLPTASISLSPGMEHCARALGWFPSTLFTRRKKCKRKSGIRARATR